MHRKKDKPGFRHLDVDCIIQGEKILAGFSWNGASSPKVFKWLISTFDHSIYSSCYHDKKCGEAKNKAERLAADKGYRISLVEDDHHTERQATLGYYGVRIGAFWGTGVNYPHFIKDNIWPLIGVK